MTIRFNQADLHAIRRRNARREFLEIIGFALFCVVLVAVTLHYSL